MKSMQRYGILASALALLAVATTARATIIICPKLATASSEWANGLRPASATINASDVSLTAEPTFTSAAATLATGSPVPSPWPYTYFNEQSQAGEWMAAQNDVVGAYIQFDLGTTYGTLSGAHVWNYWEGANNRWIKTMQIWVAPDNGGVPGSWTILGSGPSQTVTLTPPSDGYLGDEVNFVSQFGSVPKDIRFVEFYVLSGDAGNNGYIGLNEVRFEGMTVPEPSLVMLWGVGAGLLWLRQRGRQAAR